MVETPAAAVPDVRAEQQANYVDTLIETINLCRVALPFADSCPGLSLGRTLVKDSSLRRFEKNWRAYEQQVNHFRYDLKTRERIRPEDRPISWHNALFRLLPIPLNPFMGSFLYWHLG